MFDVPDRPYPDPDMDIERENEVWGRFEHAESNAYDDWKCTQGEPS